MGLSIGRTLKVFGTSRSSLLLEYHITYIPKAKHPREQGRPLFGGVVQRELEASEPGTEVKGNRANVCASAEENAGTMFGQGTEDR